MYLDWCVWEWRFRMGDLRSVWCRKFSLCSPRQSRHFSVPSPDALLQIKRQGAQCEVSCFEPMVM